MTRKARRRPNWLRRCQKSDAGKYRHGGMHRTSVAASACPDGVRAVRTSWGGLPSQMVRSATAIPEPWPLR
jgi:hypothetical protein